MRKISHLIAALFLMSFLLPINTYSGTRYHGLPGRIAPPGEKLIIVDPNIHLWGAYSANGTLIRSGLATAGSYWCADIKRRCRTKAGSFRIYSLGGPSCISNKYPLPHGGAPMPYCMFFNGGQGLHGSHQVVKGNISHGCVRVHVKEAKWLRYHFVERGTRIIIRAY